MTVDRSAGACTGDRSVGTDRVRVLGVVRGQRPAARSRRPGGPRVGVQLPVPAARHHRRGRVSPGVPGRRLGDPPGRRPRRPSWRYVSATMRPLDLGRTPPGGTGRRGSVPGTPTNCCTSRWLATRAVTSSSTGPRTTRRGSSRWRPPRPSSATPRSTTPGPDRPSPVRHVDRMVLHARRGDTYPVPLRPPSPPARERTLVQPSEGRQRPAPCGAGTGSTGGMYATTGPPAGGHRRCQSCPAMSQAQRQPKSGPPHGR